MVAHKEILSKHINKLPEEHRRYLDDNLLLINFRDFSPASFLNNHLKNIDDKISNQAYMHKKMHGKNAEHILLARILSGYLSLILADLACLFSIIVNKVQNSS